MGRAFSRSLRVCAVREVRNQVRMLESLAAGRLVLGACGGGVRWEGRWRERESGVYHCGGNGEIRQTV